MKKAALIVAAVLVPGGLIVAGLWWLFERQRPEPAQKGGTP